MQLFTNLLENSLRYTDSGGRVEVKLWYEAPYWRIDLEDSAPGVEGEHQAQIFERFFRTEGSRNRASGGVGTGSGDL